jgi:transposase
VVGQRPLFVALEGHKHPGKKVEVWFQDEARFGQQGTLTRVWAARGSRPRVVLQTEYEWVYLFASVNAATGESVALVAPSVNTEVMNLHLRQLSEQIGPERHGVLVLDGAGWHRGADLAVPANLTLLPLPAYSPELNAAERPWAYLRQHYLSNRIYRDYDELFAHTLEVWNRLTPELLRSLCKTAWVERLN